MPGISNLKKIESVQTEDAVPNEGYITYDIRFSLYYNEKRIKITINVEAQNCMDAKEEEDSISKICLKIEDIYGKKKNLPELNKMNAILIHIRDKNVGEESKNKLIVMTEELERRVEEMCNLSTVVEERGIEKGIEKGIIALISAMRKLGHCNDEIKKSLMDEYTLSDNKAAEYINNFDKK